MNCVKPFTPFSTIITKSWVCIDEAWLGIGTQSSGSWLSERYQHNIKSFSDYISLPLNCCCFWSVCNCGMFNYCCFNRFLSQSKSKSKSKVQSPKPNSNFHSRLTWARLDNVRTNQKPCPLQIQLLTWRTENSWQGWN